jgi:hypothetical protein
VQGRGNLAPSHFHLLPERQHVEFIDIEAERRREPFKVTISLLSATHLRDVVTESRREALCYTYTHYHYAAILAHASMLKELHQWLIREYIRT